MAFKEYGSYDAVGLADLVRRKQVSAHELLDEAIARTAKVDPQINAVVVKHYDYAARQIDKGLPDGPFTGVPFLLKDLDILKGTRTTSGATVLKDFVAENWLAFFFPKGTPAAIVQKLNEAAIAAMTTPAVAAQLKKNGADIVAPARRSPEYLQKFVATEIEKWAGPIKAAGLTGG